MSRPWVRVIWSSAVAILLACSLDRLPDPRTQDGERAAIAAALDRYVLAAKAVDPDAIAAAFAPGGILFEPGIFPVEGPDSIRAFVASFPGVVVESASAVPDTIQLFGRTAYLWGSYYERLVFPGQPRSEQRGRFVIEWVRQDGGTWLIQRYLRVPLPSQPLGAAPSP